jgi:ribosome maturation factor RimP
MGSHRVARKSREELLAALTTLVEPLLVREGYELVAIEVTGTGPRTILRLFIDKPGGVTLDDCASVSEAVDAMLDVEDPFESSYTLEVSSPGLDRPLRKPADYQRFAGKRAKLKTFGPVEGAGSRKVFDGTLLGLEGELVRIVVDGTPFTVPLSSIAKANLVWSFDDATLEPN